MPNDRYIRVDVPVEVVPMKELIPKNEKASEAAQLGAKRSVVTLFKTLIAEERAVHEHATYGTTKGDRSSTHPLKVAHNNAVLDKTLSKILEYGLLPLTDMLEREDSEEKQ